MKIHFPFYDQEKFPITQLFGEQFMYRGKKVSHKGVDWAMPRYTTIIAPFPGEIYRVEKDRTWGYGKTVYLRTVDKKLGRVEALFAHCNELFVRKDFRVKVGDKLAYSGRTGFWRGKNGYHLHFGLKINGRWVDPLLYLKVADPRQASMLSGKKDDSKLMSYYGNYVVRTGDTLWKISNIFYKNGGHYMDIFNANQDIIENPNLIHPGQCLRIPHLINKGL